MEKRLVVFGKVYQTKKGGTFVGYSTKSSKGKWYTVKFAQRCDLKPQGLGYSTLVLDDSDYFVKQDGDNTVVWVLNVKEIEKSNYDNGLKDELGL